MLRNSMLRTVRCVVF